MTEALDECVEKYGIPREAAFDFLIGLTTYGRIMGANEDDFRAVQGMARIRHAYLEIAPPVATVAVREERRFTATVRDDRQNELIGKSVTWSSSASKVSRSCSAYLDRDGSASVSSHS